MRNTLIVIVLFINALPIYGQHSSLSFTTEASLQTEAKRKKNACDIVINFVEFENTLEVKFPCNIDDKGLICKVIDKNDRIVLLSNPILDKKSNTFELDFSWLSKGEYILRIQNGKEIFEENIVKR